MKNRYTPRRPSWAERRQAFGRSLQALLDESASEAVENAGYLEDPALQSIRRPRRADSKTSHRNRRRGFLFNRAVIAWGFDARMHELYGGARIESDTAQYT